VKQIKIVIAGEMGKPSVKAIDDIVAVNSIDFNKHIQIVSGTEFNNCFFPTYKNTPHYRDLEYKHKKN